MNSSPAGANYWWYRGQTGPAKDSEMRAFLFLLLLFPLVELAVLIKVGSVIGVGWTLLLIVASAFIGAALLRVAGVATAWRARERLARVELPEQEMLEGLLIAVGGGLLMLPGFISDIFGILCLIPFRPPRRTAGAAPARLRRRPERPLRTGSVAAERHRGRVRAPRRFAQLKKKFHCMPLKWLVATLCNGHRKVPATRAGCLTRLARRVATRQRRLQQNPPDFDPAVGNHCLGELRL